MKVRIFLLVVVVSFLSSCAPNRIYLTPLITDKLKKSIAFIDVSFINLSTGKEIQEKGTGFFVGLPKEKGKVDLYFVTSKHLFELDPTKYPGFRPSLMKLYVHDAYGKLAKFPITFIENETVFFHENPNVDIAVVAAVPDTAEYNYNYVHEMGIIATREDFKKKGILVGTEVIFLGLFVPHIGIKQNHPIARFGRIALIADEKISWDGKELDLFLMETTSFGGNSGSPVFAYFGAKRSSTTFKYEPDVKFVGVLMGGYNKEFRMKMSTDKRVFIFKAPQNMGITAVVPSYLLHELLYSDKVRKERAERPWRIKNKIRVPVKKF